jgi:hypothetical protein
MPIVGCVLSEVSSRRVELLPVHAPRGASARDHAVRAVDGAELHRRQHRRRYHAGVAQSALQAFYDNQAVAVADETLELLPERTGSNGIAIAPSHTQDGNALLLINPHTTFYFSSELQMTSDEGLNAYGAATWGQFFGYQGFNPNVGWMHTSTGADNVDQFAETIVSGADGSLSYRYGDQLRPVTTKTIPLSYLTADGGQAERSFTTYGRITARSWPRPAASGIAFALMNKPIDAAKRQSIRLYPTRRRQQSGDRLARVVQPRGHAAGSESSERLGVQLEQLAVDLRRPGQPQSGRLSAAEAV